MAEGSDPRRFVGASAPVAAADALLRPDRDRRGGRRPGAGGVPARGPEFDAATSLHDGHLRGAGLGEERAAEAVRAVRAAVRSKRGAGWIDVEYLGPRCGAG